MASFARGFRLGAGLITLGWGASRYAQGERNWTTTAAITTGASLLVPEMTGSMTRRPTMMRPMDALMGIVANTALGALNPLR